MNKENLLGIKIREARQALDLTQAALAYRMKRTEQTIRNWERARRTPNEDDLKKLARVLKISLGSLTNV